MTDIIIFGGTTEGRRLCKLCSERGLPVRYFVATAEGEQAVRGLSGLDVRVGRLDSAQMAALAGERRPALVIDATHPFAREVSKNIRLALGGGELPFLRVTRAREEEPDCLYFKDRAELVDWLGESEGGVFVTAGSSCAAALSGLENFRERVWLRILPSVESLRICLDAGFSPERLICMQGPFSAELNRAMYRQTGAKILVTKDSGAAGGLAEKLAAARELGMQIAVLSRPEEQDAVLLETALRRIAELEL